LNEEELDKILALSPRREKIAVKDVKLRTFITDDAHRDDLVGHVYDVTYGIIKDKIDTLVVIDDSIVRGTTLKRSILRILDRLEPKKILVLSSSPQIRYPDCYGIDMSRMKDFIAFQALISLIKKNGHNEKLESAYQLALDQIDLPDEQVSNVLQSLYQLFSDQELSDEIAVLLKPSDLKAEIGILFQSIENLHVACPNHSGDWYFSGDYPTPGGFRVVNKAFINYMQGLDMRAY
jgi:amidophosphoribosyltransferase